MGSTAQYRIPPQDMMQVDLSSISFRYPTRRDIVALEDVTLKLEPGKLVALVGLSGSGKSTLVALLQRLYDPGSGQVRLAALLTSGMMSPPSECPQSALRMPSAAEMPPAPSKCLKNALRFWKVLNTLTMPSNCPQSALPNACNALGVLSRIL